MPNCKKEGFSHTIALKLLCGYLQVERLLNPIVKQHALIELAKRKTNPMRYGIRDNYF